MKLQVATVFSGIGAVEFALKRLTWEHDIIFACDNDSYVKLSYFANYSLNRGKWINDVDKINPNEFTGKIDLLVGGSPCQPYSIAGNRHGLKFQDGQLALTFFQLVKSINPTYFVFENVQNLTRVNNGLDWRLIKNRLKALEYKIYTCELNSKHFGIPQNRNRLFIIGIPLESEFKPPNNIELKIATLDMLQDNPKFISNIKVNVSKDFGLAGSFLIKNIPKVPKKYYLSKKMIDYVSKTGTKKYYAKPKFNLKISHTLLKTMHKQHRAGIDNYIRTDDKIRRLTPRETLRLMGFDDRFKIVVSDTQIYRQAGNSIVVDVLIHILQSIFPNVSMGEHPNLTDSKFIIHSSKITNLSEYFS